MRIQLLFTFIFFILVGCRDTTRVYFDAATQSAPETSGFTEIKVKLNRSSKIGVGDVNAPNSVTNREIKVPFTVSGTAVFGNHHGLKSGTVVFPPNSREARIRVPLHHNAAFEGDKTLVVSLGEPEGASLGDLTTHTLTIIETDLSPTVNLTSSNQTVSEGAGVISVPISLDYISEVDAVIPYTFSGTAIGGIDFIAAGSVTIPAGQTSGSIQITLIDNLTIDADKTIVLELGTPQGAHLGTSTTHTLTLVDNDNQPTVIFLAATQSVSESVGTVTVNVSMSKTYLLDVTVPYTISGTASNPDDHGLTSGSLTIHPGSTSGTINFSIVNDSLDESDETVLVSMGTITNGNSGSPSSQTITIEDDDPTPTVQFSSASQSVSESVGTVSVQVTLSAVSGQTVQVPYTVSGTASNPSDHNLSSGTITIPAGSSSANRSFTVNNDVVFENNETVIFTLGTPTHATASGFTTHTITITNNDPAPIVSFSSSSQAVTEGDSGTATLTATVQLNSVSGVSTTIPFSVSGTASSGTDYSVSTSSPLVIPAGNNSGTITVAVFGETTYENAETVVLTLGTPTNGTLGATTAHTITINNNDPIPTVSFSASAQTVNEGAGQIYVLFVMTNPSDFTVSIPYSISGTANYPNDHNLQTGSTTITAGNTDKVFTFSVVNDAVTEATETVIISMGAITNGNLGTPNTHTVSILDNDRKFSLSKAKLWLDAGHGTSRDGQDRLLSWTPRYSTGPVSFQNLSAIRWKWLDGFEIPLVESSHWAWLGGAVQTQVSSLNLDLIIAIHGSTPEQEVIRENDIVSWMNQFHGELAELLWVTPDSNNKNLKEIDSYLKQKYFLKNDS